MARSESVDRAGNQFLTRPRLALNQNRGLGGGHRLDMPQDVAQAEAIAQNVLEVVFGADFVAKVKAFFRQPLLGLAEFAEFERIFERNRDLTGDLLQKINILLRKCILAAIEQMQDSQRSTTTNNRQKTA